LGYPRRIKTETSLKFTGILKEFLVEKKVETGAAIKLLGEAFCRHLERLIITIPPVIIPIAINFIKKVRLFKRSLINLGKKSPSSKEKIKTNAGRAFKTTLTSATGPIPIALKAKMPAVIPRHWSPATIKIF
jgi:hypothetical protein